MNQEKNILIAQVAEAMGITSREDQNQLVRYLIETWGSDIRSNQPAQKPKTPNDFAVKTFNECSLPYVTYKGTVIGVVFEIRGKHFVFSHKNTQKGITAKEAIKSFYEGKYGNWFIPSVEMFQTVQRHLAMFNEVVTKLHGDSIQKVEYIDSSMKPNQTGFLRLAMWAPWLD